MTMDPWSYNQEKWSGVQMAEKTYPPGPIGMGFFQIVIFLFFCRTRLSLPRMAIRAEPPAPALEVQLSYPQVYAKVPTHLIHRYLL